MEFKCLFLLTLGLCLVLNVCCYGDPTTTTTMTSLRRKRRNTASYTTIADIETYLQSYHRGTSSISMDEEPTEVLDEEGNNWKVHVFSMETEPPMNTLPPCNNELSRSDAILQILRDITPEPTLLNNITPQGMAYAWMVSEDPAATTILVNPCDNMMQIVQRYALVVLYYSTSGDSWTDNEGWLTLEDECSWSKVTCHADQPTVISLTLCKYNMEASNYDIDNA
jgi:hypothetical protein